MSNQPGRAELVKQVRAKIKELGITYIYYQFVSVTGRIVGKGIPADHWEATAERGFQLVYGSTANLFVDRHKQYIGYGPEASELVGIPDPETFVQLPWDKRVARVFCTCFRNREEKVNPGGHPDLRLPRQPRASCTRSSRRSTRPASAPRLRAGDDVAEEGRGRLAGRRLHQAQLLPHRPVRNAAPGLHAGRSSTRRAMGLDMIQGDHEDAPGQLELNFMFDDALRTADRLTTYRQICAQVAREFDLIACFMPKPFMGVSANGCHHNLSLWNGGEDKVNTLGNESAAGHGGRLHLPQGRREHLHAAEGRGEAGPDRPELHRRRDQAPARADRDRLLDRQLLSPPVGHRLLGAGLCRLGLPEPHLRAAHLGARPVRIPLGRRRGEPVPDGRRAAAGLRRRHHQQARSGRAGRAQHLRGDEGRQEGARSCRCRWARRSTRWRRTRSSSGDAGRDVPRVHALQARRVGEFIATVTELGPRALWDCLP